jgi:hypothetical protein
LQSESSKDFARVFLGWIVQLVSDLLVCGGDSREPNAPFPFAWDSDLAPAAQYPNGIPAWFDRAFVESFGVATSLGVPIEVSGNRVPESSAHSIHLAASYTRDVRLGALSARWDYYWHDHAHMTVFN